MKNKTSLIKPAAVIPNRKLGTPHPTPAKLRTRRKTSEHSYAIEGVSIAKEGVSINRI